MTASINTHHQQQQYVCEVQPPTPIMCQGTFSDYVEQTNQQQCQQQQYLNAPSPRGFNSSQQQGIKRQPSTGSFSNSGNGQMGTSSTSYDLSGADDTSSSSGSNSHYTNDPYSFNSNNSSYSNSHVYEQQDFQQQQQQQYPQYQQQQQAPPANNYGANVPPSLQQAALNRRRDQQQQQQQYEYPQYQQQQQQQAYPQYQQEESQQQQQQQPRREFAAHSNNQQQFQRPRGEQEPKASLPFPECCYHKALVNRMEFIQPPPVTSAGGFAPNTRNTNYLRVFVGQCRFESTAPEIRWLIHYLTGVQPVKVELRGSGCFMAYVQNYEEVYAILRLKERLLFDHTGVWFAREEEQATFLRRYVQSYVSSIGKGFRLPKDMVVLHDQQLVQQQQQRQRGGGNNQNGNSNSALPMGASRQTRNSTNNFYNNRQ